MTEIKEQNRFLPPMRMHPAYRHGDMTPTSAPAKRWK